MCAKKCRSTLAFGRGGSVLGVVLASGISLALAPIVAVGQTSGGSETAQPSANQTPEDASEPQRASEWSDAEQAQPTDAELEELLRLERARLQGGLSSTQQQQYDQMITRYFQAAPRSPTLASAEQQRLTELESLRQSNTLSPAQVNELRALRERAAAGAYQGSRGTNLTARERLVDPAATGSLSPSQQRRLEELRRQAVQRGYDPGRWESVASVLAEGDRPLSARDQRLLQRLETGSNTVAPSQQEQLSRVPERRQSLGDRQLRQEYQRLEQGMRQGGVPSRDQLLRYYQLRSYQQSAQRAGQAQQPAQGSVGRQGVNPNAAGQPSTGSVPAPRNTPATSGQDAPQNSGSNQGSVNTGAGGG